MQTTCAKCGTDNPPRSKWFQIDGGTVCRDCKDLLRPLCPACGAAVKSHPRACKACGASLRVRSRQELFDSTILTEDQCFQVDWMVNLEQVGITQEDFTRRERETVGESGSPPAARDVIWGLLVLAAVGTSEPVAQARVEMLKAEFLGTEGRDKNGLAMLKAERKMHEAHLRELLKYTDVTHVQIRPANGACDACIANARTLSIEEALRTHPLPCLSCTNEGADDLRECRCCYIMVEPEYPPDETVDPAPPASSHTSLWDRLWAMLTAPW